MNRPRTAPYACLCDYPHNRASIRPVGRLASSWFPPPLQVMAAPGEIMGRAAEEVPEITNEVASIPKARQSHRGSYLRAIPNQFCRVGQTAVGDHASKCLRAAAVAAGRCPRPIDARDSAPELEFGLATVAGDFGHSGTSVEVPIQEPPDQPFCLRKGQRSAHVSPTRERGVSNEESI
jgi:hypothetical protein